MRLDNSAVAAIRMKTSSSEGVDGNSASALKSTGSDLTKEISGPHSVTMEIGNNKNGSKEHLGRADTAVSAPRRTPREIVTAAALLWGRSPTMARSDITSSSSTSSPSSSSSSASSTSVAPNDQHTKSNSPASNAAAALLVGMSMRTVQEGSTPPERTEAQPPAVSVDDNDGATTEAKPDEDEGQTNVEREWRRIRLEIAQELLESALSSGQKTGKGEEDIDPLELPKGVTRRPSGAWQAQIYFAGKTRYIGVWEKAYLAANAYNRTKEALKEIKKAQKKSCSKRKRHSTGSPPKARGESSAMSTPRRKPDLVFPPSITWPSSASSSSTASSSNLRSPSSSGPLKKRRGLDCQDLPQARTLRENAQPVPQSQGYPYSTFSQHFQQQPLASMGVFPNGLVQPPGNLAHPALQLLSLRPQPAALWMQHPRPPPPPYHVAPNHPVQHYHHRPPHQFPYAPPMFPSNRGINLNSVNHGRVTPTIPNNAARQSAPLKAKNGKKATTKSKGSKSSSSHRKKNSKPSKELDNQPSARQAENEKWKWIRAEVVKTFFASKKQAPEGDHTAAKKVFDKDVLRGITVRPSGKFQAQLYFGGRSRYIGVFDSEFDAATVYEMIRSRLKNEPKGEHSVRAEDNRKSEGHTPALPSAATAAGDGKADKNPKAAVQTTAAATTTSIMRSITPSPTPRGNNRREPANVVLGA